MAELNIELSNKQVRFLRKVLKWFDMIESSGGKDFLDDICMSIHRTIAQLPDNYNSDMLLNSTDIRNIIDSRIKHMLYDTIDKELFNELGKVYKQYKL